MPVTEPLQTVPPPQPVHDIRPDKRGVGKARAFLAGTALGVSLMTGSVESELVATEPASYHEISTDVAAVKRLEHNLELFRKGDKETLKTIVDASDFAASYHLKESNSISFGTLKQIDTASSVEEIDNILTSEFRRLGFGFRVRFDNRPGEYKGVRALDMQRMRATAFGIVNATRSLWPVMNEDDRLDIEIAGELEVSAHGRGNAAGLYYGKGPNGRALIRMGLQTDSRGAQDTLEHEWAHHEHITEGGIGNDFLELDGGWLRYSGDEGKTNAIVGRDVGDSYAAINYKEDAAQMVEYLLGSSKVIGFDNTLLQQKLRYVMTQLESQYPGISAYILHEASLPDEPLQAYPSYATDEDMHRARVTFMAGLLLCIGSTVLARRQRQKV